MQYKQAAVKKTLRIEHGQSQRLVTSSATSSGKVVIQFDGQTVSNPWIADVRVANSGDVPILAADNEVPPTLSFHGSRIVSASISSKSDTNPVVVLDTTLDTVRLRQQLLNPGDWYVVSVIVDGEVSKPTVSARIAGIAKVEEIQASGAADVSQKKASWLSRELFDLFRSVTGVLGLVLLGLSGSSIYDAAKKNRDAKTIAPLPEISEIVKDKPFALDLPPSLELPAALNVVHVGIETKFNRTWYESSDDIERAIVELLPANVLTAFALTASGASLALFTEYRKALPSRVMAVLLYEIKNEKLKDAVMTAGFGVTVGENETVTSFISRIQALAAEKYSTAKLALKPSFSFIVGQFVGGASALGMGLSALVVALWS